MHNHEGLNMEQKWVSKHPDLLQIANRTQLNILHYNTSHATIDKIPNSH